MKRGMRPAVVFGTVLVLFLAGCWNEQSSNRTNEKKVLPQASVGTTNDARVPLSSTDEKSMQPILDQLEAVEIPRIKSWKPPQPEANRTNEEKELLTSSSSNNADSGRLVVRLSAEPRNLNPLLDISAIRNFIGAYLHDPLVAFDPTTMAPSPCLASEWEIGDSLLFKPDHPGFERLIEIGGQPAAYDIEFEVVESEPSSKSLSLRTVDSENKSVSRTWIGIFDSTVSPKDVGPIRESWSGDDGNCSFEGLPVGKYRVIAASELLGHFRRVDGEIISEATTDQLAQRYASTSILMLRPTSILTFTLDSRARWSDGTPVTAEDFEFTFAILQNNYVDADAARARFRDISLCEAIAPNSVRFRFRRLHFQSLDLSSRFSTCLHPKHFIQKHLAETHPDATEQFGSAAWGKAFNQSMLSLKEPLGNGRYVVRAWDRTDYLEFERSPNYQFPDRAAKNQWLRFKFIADSTTAITALRANEIHVCFGLSPDIVLDASSASAFSNFKTLLWQNPSVSFVTWNCQRWPFDDQRVRVAMALLCEREEFAQLKLKDTAVVISGPQYVLGPAYDRSVLPIAFDPEAAADLLTQAGWLDTDNDGVLDKNGKRFEFTYISPTSSGNSDFATIYQKILKSAGITMKIQQQEWGSFGERLRHGDFEAAELGYVPHWETDLFPMWHSSAIEMSRAANPSGFTHPDLDRLVEVIPTVTDFERRTQLQHDLHRVLDRFQPCLFLYNRQSCALSNKEVHGIQLFPTAPGFDLSRWTISSTSAN